MVNVTCYHQHAATLLEALRVVDLLNVATAIAAGNFVLTIDEASASLPRQTLDEMIANMLCTELIRVERLCHTDVHRVLGIPQLHAAQ
jgi:hypothetical protein